MTNLANAPYLQEVELPTSPIKELAFEPSHKRSGKQARRALSAEDLEIVVTLEKLKDELSSLHNRYDQTSDPLLLDSLIYELKAVNMRYIYYLQLCKEKGIVGSVSSIPRRRD